MEKMTIEKARENIAQKKEWEKTWKIPEHEHLDVDGFLYLWNYSKGFIEGWESRNEEVEELKKQIDSLKKEIECLKGGCGDQ